MKQHRVTADSGSSPQFFRLLLASAISVAVVYVLVADGDLDFGQRDSVQYLSVGMSLAEGAGLTVPFDEPGGPLELASPLSPYQFYPPGLPIVLAAFLALGLPAASTMVGMQAVTVALLGLGLAWQVLGATSSKLRASVAGLVGWSTGVFLADQFVTEPLYVLLVAVVIGLLARVGHPTWLRVLPILALAGFAALVRLIGSALVLPVVWAMRSSELRLRPKLAIATAATVAIAGPVLGWVAATREHSNRALGWHPPSLVDIKVGLTASSSWLAPIQLGTVPRVGLAAMAAFFITAYLLRSGETPSARAAKLSSLWAVYAIGHLGVLLAVMSVADAQTRLISRQLAPVGMALVLAIIVRLPSGVGAAALLSPMVVAAIAMGIAGFAKLEEESGYGEEPWSSSLVFERIENSDADLVLSNSPEAIWVNTGVSTFTIPTATNPWTDLSNGSLEAELDELKAAMAQSVVEIVLFDGMRSYLVERDALFEAGFVIGERFDIATVLVESAG